MFFVFALTKTDQDNIEHGVSAAHAIKRIGEKDYSALVGAQKFYESNIKQLMLESCYNDEVYFKDYYEIEDIEYDLFDVIKTFIKE